MMLNKKLQVRIYVCFRHLAEAREVAQKTLLTKENSTNSNPGSENLTVGLLLSLVHEIIARPTRFNPQNFLHLRQTQTTQLPHIVHFAHHIFDILSRDSRKAP